MVDIKDGYVKTGTILIAEPGQPIEPNKILIKQSKWKSPVFWGTIATSLVGVLSLLGFWSWVGVDQDMVLRVIGAVIAVASQLVGNWNDADIQNAAGV